MTATDREWFERVAALPLQNQRALLRQPSCCCPDRASCRARWLLHLYTVALWADLRGPTRSGSAGSYRTRAQRTSPQPGRSPPGQKLSGLAVGRQWVPRLRCCWAPGRRQTLQNQGGCRAAEQQPQGCAPAGAAPRPGARARVRRGTLGPSHGTRWHPAALGRQGRRRTPVRRCRFRPRSQGGWIRACSRPFWRRRGGKQCQGLWK